MIRELRRALGLELRFMVWGILYMESDFLLASPSNCPRLAVQQAVAAAVQSAVSRGNAEHNNNIA